MPGLLTESVVLLPTRRRVVPALDACQVHAFDFGNLCGQLANLAQTVQLGTQGIHAPVEPRVHQVCPHGGARARDCRMCEVGQRSVKGRRGRVARIGGRAPVAEIPPMLRGRHAASGIYVHHQLALAPVVSARRECPLHLSAAGRARRGVKCGSAVCALAVRVFELPYLLHEERECRRASVSQGEGCNGHSIGSGAPHSGIPFVEGLLSREHVNTNHAPICNVRISLAHHQTGGAVELHLV